MEKQYKITARLIEDIQKVTSGASQEVKQEFVDEGSISMPKGNDPHSQGVRVAMGSREMVKKYTPGSEEHKQFMAGHAVGKTQVKKKMDSLEPKIKTMGEAIYVPPVSHVSPPNPTSSSKDEDNRKASMLIDKIRSFRHLKQDYKEKGNLERHREFHAKLHDADKEYQKLGHKSLLRKDDHVVEEVEQFGEAKGLASMTMDQLKQEHDRIKNKINDIGKSQMISMNHPLSQRARLIRLNMAIKKKQANEEIEQDVLAVMLGEALHPNQQKIDVVDDEKIDAKDFAKLRSMKNKKTGKIHNCAVHVEHPEYGIGECISEAHADPDENGNIAWYTVKFEDSTQVVQTEDIKVLASESHMHNEGAMSDLDADRKERAYKTRQAKTTMKHIANPTPGEKKAAKDIKPGIAGYRDRVAMLKSAQARGALKEEVEDQFADYDEVIESKPLEFELQDSYNFGDYLSASKKIVGEEDAINLANEAFNKQDISLFVEEMTRNEVESRVKTHMNAGHEVSTPKYSTRDGKFHAEFIVKDKESGVRRKYIYHGNTRKMENMGTPGKRD